MLMQCEFAPKSTRFNLYPSRGTQLFFRAFEFVFRALSHLSMAARSPALLELSSSSDGTVS
jgi:hypothetical protein